METVRLLLTQNKTLLFLLGGLLFAVGFIFIIVLSLFSQTSQPIPTTPSPTPIPTPIVQNYKYSPLQKTEPGKTTFSDLSRIPNLREIPSTISGTREFIAESVSPLRPNQILVRDNTVIFERILTPIKSSDYGYARISDFTEKYGEPDRIIQGSRHYGSLMNTYIYADQGFTLIGNPFTNEVFEIQQFLPISVERYLQLYSEDIFVEIPEEVAPTQSYPSWVDTLPIKNQYYYVEYNYTEGRIVAHLYPPSSFSQTKEERAAFLQTVVIQDLQQQGVPTTNIEWIIE